MIALSRRRRRRSHEPTSPGKGNIPAGMRVKREITVRDLATNGVSHEDDVVAIYLRDRGVLVCLEHALDPTALRTIAAVGSPDLVVVLLIGTPKAQRLLRRRCLRCELDSNAGATQ